MSDLSRTAVESVWNIGQLDEVGPIGFLVDRLVVRALFRL